MTFFTQKKVKAEYAKYQKTNQENRNVYEYSTPLSIRDFWNHTGAKDFTITGGNSFSRSGILALAISELEYCFSYPVIVLNGDSYFEKKIEDMARQRQLGRAVLSSQRHPNYDAFFGMDNTSIRRTVEEAAAQKGMSNISEIGDYTKAFLSILGRKYVPSLNSILAMGRLSDREIVEFGASNGAKESELAIIRNGTLAGRHLRVVLNDISAALINIKSQKTTRVNLSNPGFKYNVAVVWAFSSDQALFNTYIAQEINTLLSKRTRFALIANNVVFEQDDPLGKAFNNVQQRSDLISGICCQSVALWNERNNRNQTRGGNSPAMVVLNSGDEDPVYQEDALNRFGKYTYYDTRIGESISHGRRLRDSNSTQQLIVSQFEKSRVTLEDMRGFKIAARGHLQDRVGLYPDFTF